MKHFIVCAFCAHLWLRGFFLLCGGGGTLVAQAVANSLRGATDDLASTTDDSQFYGVLVRELHDGAN